MGPASAQSRKALERAEVLRQKGDLAGAEALYQSVLRRDAAAVDALHGLALVYARQGRLEEARQHLDRALGLDPTRPELHFHRAEIVGALGLTEQALESYAEALALRPDFFEVLVNMADVLLRLERPAEALEHLDHALRLRPGDVAALNNRGNALQALKRHEDALQCFDQVLRSLPGHADVLNNRASALLSLARFAEAESTCRDALASNPAHVMAGLNLGRALGAQGILEEALRCYESALDQRPAEFDAWCERAAILRELQRHEEARDCLRRAMELDAQRTDTWNDLGSTLLLLGDHAGALKAYERSLALRADNAAALANHGLALQFLGRLEDAIPSYEKALRLDARLPYAEGKLAWLRLNACDWRSHSADAERIVAGIHAGQRVSEPFELMFLTGHAADQLECARIYARDKYPRATASLWKGERYRHDRIRLAYLSGDFREHPTSYLIAGLLEMHDRGRFELFGFSHGPEDRGPTAARVAAAFEHFVDLRGLTDRAFAELLRRHEIDIAVNLMGYTTFGRTGVYAVRPCPVHVSYLGYPGTLGNEFTDYILADPFVAPPGSEAHFAERVARLPDTFQASDALRARAERKATRADAGLPERSTVFSSFNKASKITPEVFNLWMQILLAVEDSVLWLLGGAPLVRENLSREAESRGVSASRLVFSTWARYDEHLARLKLADLALDTLPFNGGATTSDALWAGVPVVTCPGEAFAARMSGSLLRAIGMPELIAPSLEEYKALAIRLGTDRGLLAATRRKLAANRETRPLFDTDRFRRHLEAAYEIMYRRYQNGEPPASFSIEAIEPARA